MQTDEARKRLPIFSNRTFELNFRSVDKYDYYWAGDIYRLGEATARPILSLLSSETMLERIASNFGYGSTYTLIESSPSENSIFIQKNGRPQKWTEVGRVPSSVDLDNAVRAFYQQVPGPVMILLMSGLAVPRDIANITMADVSTLLTNDPTIYSV